jgi:hypothetical protein
MTAAPTRHLRSETVSLDAVHDYWRAADETAVVFPELKSHWIGWGEPFCFGCGWLAPVKDGPNAWAKPATNGWLERAHLVDHFLGGSGRPENLVPLCHLCHDAMPMQETRESALKWVRERKCELPMEQAWQLFTDCRGANSGGQSRQVRMHRLKAEYMAVLLRIQTEENATLLAARAVASSAAQGVRARPGRYSRTHGDAVVTATQVATGADSGSHPTPSEPADRP